MNFPWKRILTRWKKGYARFWDFFFKGPSWSPPPDGLVSNRFHYRSSSLMLFVWCKGILKRIFTLPGEFLFLVMLFSGFYSSTIFNTPAVLLFFVLLSIFLIDFTAGLVFFPKLSGTRSMPDRVRSGEPFTVCCCIRNRRRRMPVFDLIADPFLRFPGNAKEETPVPVKEIPGGGEITLEREVTVSRRGVHKIGAFLAETSYPFHLLKISRNLDPRPSILICHPRPLALDPEEIRTGTGDALLPAGGNSLFPRTGESMNFHGYLLEGFSTAQNTGGQGISGGNTEPFLPRSGHVSTLIFFPCAGEWRRILLMDFPVSFDPEERNAPHFPSRRERSSLRRSV